MSQELQHYTVIMQNYDVIMSAYAPLRNSFHLLVTYHYKMANILLVL